MENFIVELERHARTKDGKIETIDHIISFGEYKGILIKYYKEYIEGNKKLEEIITNKADYKEFINALKYCETRLSMNYGTFAGASLRAFFRTECRKIILLYGGFFDKRVIRKDS